MSKNQIIIALIVLSLVGIIWGSVQDKKSIHLERQLAAMKAQPLATSESQAGSEELVAQNQMLLADVEKLKESVVSQQEEIAGLQEELVKSAGGSQAIEAMQAQLDKCTAEVASLEKALISEEEASAGLENMKSALANSVDVYSAKSQNLSAEVDEYGQRILALEKALEERTKSLVASGVELDRTKLNMNVLLSKIVAQNNSLEILEETRITLEKELSAKFLAIEELQRQLSAQVVAVPVPAEETQPVAVEEAPAH